MLNFKQYDWKKYNFTLLIVMVILGICSAYFVSFAAEITMGEDKAPAYFKRQIIALIVALIIAVVVSLIDYKRICDFTVIYYAITTLMAIGTRIPGIRTDNDTDSYRWIKMPGSGFTFQPSEICKIAIILMLAVFCAKVSDEMDSWKTFLKALGIMALPTFFIFIQTDLSSSIVIFFIFSMILLAAGLSYRIILPIVIVSVPLLIGGVWLVQQPMVYDHLGTHKYQVNRVVGFLHPDDKEYAINENFQQLKSVAAIGSGELTGKMLDTDLADGRAYFHVDVCESDFIFAVVGEETGFIGSVFIIALYGIIIFQCVRTAKRCNDTAGYLIAIGISAMLAFQVFANIGVATLILPNTGLPLPFLSNGISSLLGCSVAMGLVINIGIQSGTGDRFGIRFM